MTSQEYLRSINWWTDDDSDGEFWCDQWQLAEVLKAYSKQAVIEAYIEGSRFNKRTRTNKQAEDYFNNKENVTK